MRLQHNMHLNPAVHTRFVYCCRKYVLKSQNITEKNPTNLLPSTDPVLPLGENLLVVPKSDYCDAVSKSSKLNPGRDQERERGFLPNIYANVALQPVNHRGHFTCLRASEKGPVPKMDIVSFIGSDKASSVRTGAGHLQPE